MFWYNSLVWGRKNQALLNLLRSSSVIRARDLDELQIPRNYLGRLTQKGLLQKIERGLYRTTSSQISEHINLLEMSSKVPKAIICLLSALQFHEIRAQFPLETWVAIDVKAWTPKMRHLPVRIVRLTGKTLGFGIQEHRVEGRLIRVFSPAKTVADCFKFRNKIGMEVAVNALHECDRLKKATMQDMWEAARICRVTKIMEPYLATLSSQHETV